MTSNDIDMFISISIVIVFLCIAILLAYLNDDIAKFI